MKLTKAVKGKDCFDSLTESLCSRLSNAIGTASQRRGACVIFETEQNTGHPPPYGRTMFNIGMSLADQATISGVRFITTVLIARYAGSEEVGIYSISFGFLLIATCMQDALVCAPFTLFHSRSLGNYLGRYQGSVLFQVVTVGLVSAICFGVAWGLGRAQGSTLGLNEAFGALALSTPFVLLREFARRVELARLRLTAAFCIDAISGCLQLLFIGLLIRFDLLQIGGVYFAMGASCAIPAVVWLGVAYRESHYHLPSVVDDMQRHWAVGRWPFFAQILGILHLQGVLWIVGWQLGVATAGMFAVCNYAIFLVNPLALGVCNVLSPLAVQTFQNSGLSRVRALVWMAMLGMSAAIALFSIVAYWYADIILVTIYKDPALQGHELLMLLLGINMALGVAHMMNDQGVWAIEHPSWLLRSTLLTVTVTFVLAIPLVLVWSLNGAALSLIVGRFVGLTYQSARFFLGPIGGDKDPLLETRGPA